MYCLWWPCMTIHVSAEDRTFKSAHCAKPLVCVQDVCVFRWCVAAVSNRACGFVRRACGCMFIVYSLTVSVFYHRPLCPTPAGTERPTACQPTRRGHTRLWCYSDRRGAYGITLSVIWQSVLTTVSGALIPERNGLSQFNEDTGAWRPIDTVA